MGFFDRLLGGHDMSSERDGTVEGSVGGDPRTYDVSDRDGNAVRYSSDDFDEIYATLDEQEMRHLVGIGWLLLDERVGASEGPERTEFVMRPTFGGDASGYRAAPVTRAGDDLTGYVLGHLKPGREGTRL